jgi:exodeoxyribonuclease V alpha subunit
VHLRVPALRDGNLKPRNPKSATPKKGSAKSNATLELTASFDGRTISYRFGELDTLVLAYAATIHKIQGSEYPAVVIPVMTQHYAMLQRNLLYTGVTRGKKLVVLVGQKKAVAIAVRNVSGRRRWSKLSEWLGSKKICRSRQ